MITSSPKPLIFVSMPYGKANDEKYHSVIKPACDVAGAICERVDDFVFRGNIIQEVKSRIAQADLVIADISEASPNVWYELGYAQALGKKILVLAKSTEKLPLDLAAFRVIFSGGASMRLRQELTTNLMEVISPKAKRPGRPGIPGRAKVIHVSTIVFGDIVGSTSIMSKLGELDSGQVISHYLVRVEGIARKHGGHLVKSVGDGFFAVFAKADDAVAFALDLGGLRLHDAVEKAPLIQIRIGIHSGPTLVQRTQYGEDLIGEAVVTCARLAQAAHPDEILISSATMKKLSERIKYPLASRNVRLKGISKEIKVSVLNVGKRIGRKRQ
jgi:class 3 adenylate cyclase